MQRKILRWFSQCFQIFHWRSIQNHWRWRWEITRIVAYQRTAFSIDKINFGKSVLWKIYDDLPLFFPLYFFYSLRSIIFCSVGLILRLLFDWYLWSQCCIVFFVCFQRPNAGEHSIFIFGAIKVMQQFLRDKDYYYTHFDTTSFSELSFRKQRQRAREIHNFFATTFDTVFENSRKKSYS